MYLGDYMTLRVRVMPDHGLDGGAFPAMRYSVVRMAESREDEGIVTVSPVWM